MTNENLLGIGAFSLLSRLSITALRHYDEVGVLQPGFVDPRTGYRRYAPAQLRAARLVQALRSVDLPIEEVRTVVEAADDHTMRDVLVRHRARLAERSHTVARMVTKLDDYIERGIRVNATRGCRIVEINAYVDELEAARRFYEAAFDVEFVEERHGDGPRHLMASFGKWPSDQFFLLNLSERNRDPDRTGRADFGFLVDDLDTVHKRAIAAGATEDDPPQVLPGMPRSSSILDPSGNRINLYQDSTSEC